jgi:hypothetical protein
MDHATWKNQKRSAEAKKIKSKTRDSKKSKTKLVLILSYLSRISSTTGITPLSLVCVVQEVGGPLSHICCAGGRRSSLSRICCTRGQRSGHAQEVGGLGWLKYLLCRRPGDVDTHRRPAGWACQTAVSTCRRSAAAAAGEPPARAPSRQWWRFLNLTAWPPPRHGNSDDDSSNARPSRGRGAVVRPGGLRLSQINFLC